MADMDPPGPGTKPDADLPTSLTRLAFHGPLSEARAARLIGRLTQAHAATVLDIGCGWGELMLRILAAAPDAIRVGLDTGEGDLARGRDNAKTRGLEDRVTFVRASGVGITRGPADLVLCVGASHALSDAQPPEHTAAALPALRRLVTAGGRGLLGDGFWHRPPAGADLAGMGPGASAGEYHDLAGLVDLAVDAGFRPAWIETASLQEWEDFESGYQYDEEEWLATHHHPPRGPRGPGAGGRGPGGLAARLLRHSRNCLPHSDPRRLSARRKTRARRSGPRRLIAAVPAERRRPGQTLAVELARRQHRRHRPAVAVDRGEPGPVVSVGHSPGRGRTGRTVLAEQPVRGPGQAELAELRATSRRLRGQRAQRGGRAQVAGAVIEQLAGQRAGPLAVGRLGHRDAAGRLDDAVEAAPSAPRPVAPPR